MIRKSKKIVVVLVILMLLLVGMQFLATASACKPGGKGKYKGLFNKYKKWHPDFLKDSDGTLHIVWQKCYDGQYDIMYSTIFKQKNKCRPKYATNTIRLTDTPDDSVRPKIAIDPVSDIIYVVWKEFNQGTDVDVTILDDDVPIPSIMYRATKVGEGEEESDEQEWTEPINLASVSTRIKDFDVDDSDFEISTKGKNSNTYQGIFDTDKDQIKDSAEVLGSKGYKTNWRDPDTDKDGIWDNMEMLYELNPLVDDSQTQLANRYIEVLLLTSDTDSDSLTYIQEISDLPVTMGVACIRNNGHATYRFYPRDNHEAYLHLGLQLRRQGLVIKPPAEMAYYKVDVTVNSGEIGVFELSESGTHMEWDRFEIEIGPFDVGEDFETDIQIEVDITPPKDEISQAATNTSIDLPPQIEYFKSLEIYSLMLAAPAPDYDIFNYKEGRDFVPDLSESLWELVENFEISGDRNRPDLFVEIDYLAGHEFTPELYSEAVNAFSDAGIRFHYKIDESNLPLTTDTDPDPHDDDAETIAKGEEMEQFFEDHKNTELPEYVHLIVGHKCWTPSGGGRFIYGTARSADDAADTYRSGVYIGDEELVETVTVDSTLFERRLKVFIHELGHVLCSSHEKDAIDGGSYSDVVDGDDGIDDFNEYNVMRQDAIHDDRADQLIRGDGNANDRNLGATELIGMPRFSIESVWQIDLTNKLSVDTGRNILLLDNYV